MMINWLLIMNTGNYPEANYVNQGMTVIVIAIIMICFYRLWKLNRIESKEEK